MLYDPKWEQKTKADPLELSTLIAWLGTKNPSQRYDFDNCKGECLFSQYIVGIGLPKENEDFASDLIWQKLHELHGGVAYCPGAHTFGAALERARERAAS